MEKAQALEQISRMADFEIKPVHDTGRVRVLPADNTLAIRPTGRTMYTVEEEKLGNVLGFAGIPVHLTKQIAPRTLATVLQDVLQRKGEVTFLTQGEHIIDVVGTNQYHKVDPEKVFRAVDKAVPGFDVLNLREMPHHTVSLELLGIDNPIEVRPGVNDIGEKVPDLIKAGVLVEFSPIGTSNALVTAFIQRLICSNGAIDNTVLRRFEYGRGGAGEGDDIYQYFRRASRDAYQAVNVIAERYGHMKDEGITPEERALVIAAMIKECGLGKEAAAAVRARAIEAPPETAYDVFNLFTWAATHVEQDNIRVQRARIGAANFMDEGQHQRVCPTCRHAR